MIHKSGWFESRAAQADLGCYLERLRDMFDVRMKWCRKGVNVDGTNNKRGVCGSGTQMVVEVDVVKYMRCVANVIVKWTGKNSEQCKCISPSKFAHVT